jgi:hypothetical protein
MWIAELFPHISGVDRVSSSLIRMVILRKKRMVITGLLQPHDGACMEHVYIGQDRTTNAPCNCMFAEIG